MLDDLNFPKEFLTELNRNISQSNSNLDLEDVILPIKNLFLKDTELFSYSLCRHFGGNIGLSFFCQWFYQYTVLSKNNKLLEQENLDYFQKKISVYNKDKSQENHKNIQQAIAQILPLQQRILQTKTIEIMEKLSKTDTYLENYLSSQYQLGFITSEIISCNHLYTEKLTVAKYIEAQGVRGSFALLGFPILLGLLQYFNRPENKLLKASLKLVLLEETVKQISKLHQIAQTKDLWVYIYQSRLENLDQLIAWQKLSDEEKQETATSSTDVKEIYKNFLEKIYNSSINNLKYLNLPEKFNKQLLEINSWVYHLNILK